MDPSPGPGLPPADTKPDNTEGAFIRPLLTLVAITALVWLIFTVSGYGKRYAQMAKPWAKGDVNLVEITVTKEDINNLFCASDVVLAGRVRCAYGANQQRPTPPVDDDRLTLRPYVTVNRELLLGTGLWSAPELQSNIPDHRFTIACNFRILDVVKSVSLRWSPTGNFDPAKQSIPAGTLTDCAYPR
jgi:hypothetical protein